MPEEKSLAVQRQPGMSANLVLIQQLDNLLRTGRLLRLTGLLPKEVDSDEKAASIIIMSEELHIGMMTGFRNISIINGKAHIGWKLLLAKAQSSGEVENMKVVGDEKSCTITVQRRGWDAHTNTFTMEDAQKLGNAGKDNYKRQPANMLKGCAIAANLRVTFADYCNGLEVRNDVADFENDEEIIISEDFGGNAQVAVTHPNAPTLAEAERTTVTPPRLLSKVEPPQESPVVSTDDPPFFTYDYAEVWQLAAHHFDDETGLTRWLEAAKKLTSVSPTMTSEGVYQIIKTDIHVLSVPKNKQLMTEFFTANKYTIQDFLKLAVDGKPLERLSQLPNDFAWIMNRAQEIVEPDFSADEIEDGEVVEDDVPPTLVEWAWDDANTTTFEKLLTDSFPDHTAKQMRDSIKTDKWILPPNEERDAVMKQALKGNWRVKSDTVSYDKDHIVFHSIIGELWFYSTTEFMKLLPASYVRANGIANWKGMKEVKTIDPLVLSWTEHVRKDEHKTVYRMVERAEPFDDIDAKLFGDENGQDDSSSVEDENPLL